MKKTNISDLLKPEPMIITSTYMDFSWYPETKIKRGSKFTPKKKKRKKKC